MTPNTITLILTNTKKKIDRHIPVNFFDRKRAKELISLYNAS